MVGTRLLQQYSTKVKMGFFRQQQADLVDSDHEREGSVGSYRSEVEDGEEEGDVENAEIRDFVVPW
jgi:hypothetical protein